MGNSNKLKDEELLLDKLSSEAADYVYEAKDYDFSVLVEVTSIDGWVSCNLVKSEGYEKL